MHTLAALVFAGSIGMAAPQESEDLADLSLESLMDLEVSITSRESVSADQIPGAVYVLSGDEIRAAGLTSIPEALRLVPGLFVSRWSNSNWDVTARGFGTGTANINFAFLNQLLVLVDGVAVYSPLFAGVWWPLQDIDMEDVDRIEVVRGPGGILWGANATHGVVHVITKDSKDTLGPRVSGQYTSIEGHASARYGAKLGETGRIRAWIKHADYSELGDFGTGFDLGWGITSAGVRADFDVLGDRRASVQLRAWDADQGAIGIDFSDFSFFQADEIKRGFSVSGQLVDEERDEQVSAWFTSDDQDSPSYFNNRVHTLDLNYQRAFEVSETTRLTVGSGWRSTWFDLEGQDPEILTYNIDELRLDTFRIYGLGRRRFEEARAELTLGLTLEHNDLTEFEVQPTLRGLWNATDTLSLWAGATRAVRTPSIGERFVEADFVTTTSDYHSEVLWAYELGVRSQLTESTNLDLALFYNDYDELHVDSSDGFGGTLVTNQGEGEAHGAELALDSQLSEHLSMRSAFSYIESSYRDFDSSDLGTDQYYPRQQANVRLRWQPIQEFEFDLNWYAVDGLQGVFEAGEYTRTDLRLAWKAKPGTEIYFGVQNLTDATHEEFVSGGDIVLPRTALLGFRTAF